MSSRNAELAASDAAGVHSHDFPVTKMSRLLVADLNRRFASSVTVVSTTGTSTFFSTPAGAPPAPKKSSPNFCADRNPLIE